jgi:phosphonate metabolism-associated iron-containing alcohol dehydrogenase
MQDRSHCGRGHPVCVQSGNLDEIAPFILGDHVLVVTTPGFVRRGAIDRLRHLLAPKLLTVWAEVKPNPDIRDIDNAASVLQNRSIDLVIGLGGGSALDTAKVLATLLANQASPTLCQKFRDDAGGGWATRLPLIAIPTTSGTGAEVTPFATIWDHERQQKYSLSEEFVSPDLAWLDPTLTLTLNEEETLYPGLDTISHSLESLWNKNLTPASRCYAFKALELSGLALPRVLIEPNNLVNRQNLQQASLLAGLAISVTRTAISHAISYPLTTHYGMPHGLACSFTLLYLLRQVKSAIITDLSEENTIEKIANVLESCDLKNRVLKYGQRSEIIQIASRANNTDRSSNFFMKLDDDAIHNIIFNSI